MLVRMVESRVAERDRVRSDINDWSMRFSLEEGAPSTTSLNDMERGVLHFVDGRKSVEDIATALRESNLNTACYLMSLRLQGFIREASSTTKRFATSRPVEPAQTPVAPTPETTTAVDTQAASEPAPVAPPTRTGSCQARFPGLSV